MWIKIKEIGIENFKGCRLARHKFGERTYVCGANATGKTTIFDAFAWAFFNKDSHGTEKFDIRPLDEDGNRIDNVEIKVSVTVEVDGREMEFTKTQKQNWVKKRGTQDAVLQGNVNSYQIDGYPKSEKDYKAAVADIIDEDLFKMLTSPTHFTGLKWKEQREILMRLVDSVSDYELAKDKPEFSELLDELRKAPSTEDIQKKYQKALAEWKKKQGEIPVRIDEVEKQRVDADVAELESRKKSIVKHIENNQEKQADTQKLVDEYLELSDGVTRLVLAQGDLVKQANLDNSKKRMDLEKRISGKKFLLRQVEESISDAQSEISSLNDAIRRTEELITDLRTKYTETQKLSVDEESLVCAYCKQSLPEDKQDEIRGKFEETRKAELAGITEKGNSASRHLKNLNARLPEAEKELAGHKESREMLNKAIADLEKELGSLPESIDVTDSAEYKELESQIAEKEMAMRQMNDAGGIRKELDAENRNLNQKLIEIERQIALSAKNAEIDERVSDLKAEQREVAQKVADVEKVLYLLEQFIRHKMNIISESINSKFDGVCFKLFDLQLNGGLKECCEVTCDGVPHGSLNAGHKIISGLKIIKALQESYGINAPIFVDNAESINDFNLPEMDCQMILLKVSEDKELKIETE